VSTDVIVLRVVRLTLVRLARLASSYHQFDRTLLRLRQLGSSSGIALSGYDILRQVVDVNDFFSKFSSGLVELRSALQRFACMNLEPAINHDVEQGIERAVVASLDLKNRIKTVVEDMKLSSFPVLLQGECYLFERFKFFIFLIQRSTI